MATIDALFGSKTRVKLLQLFMNNPEKSFYVREITRLIDEQINSVRRELSNLLDVGVITSDNADNKLYYQANQLYEFYVPFRKIFAGAGSGEQPTKSKQVASSSDKWRSALKKVPGVRVAIAAGVLVEGSASPIDFLLVGDIPAQKAKVLVKAIERQTGRSLNYSLLDFDELYYRLSVRDKFITEILTSQHEVLADTDNVLERQIKEE